MSPSPFQTAAARQWLLLLISIVLFAWLALNVPAANGCFTPAFKTSPTFTVTNNQRASPYFIVSGDFNNDGRTDVVISTDSSNGTWLRLGTGGASFGPATQVAGAATHLATADFNNDNKLDLATVLSSGQVMSVSVYLGNGAGGFSLSQAATVGTQPETIVTADFNSDGKVDLATVNLGSNNVSVALGDGTGHFAAPMNFSVGAQPRGLAVGDFNSDGKPDLVTTSTFNDGSIQVLLNTGGGNFSAPINTDRFGTALYISVADFNNDNKADVALALNNSNTISVRLGNGSGGFNAYNGTNDYNIISQPGNLTIADFNGDNKLDIVAANRMQSSAVSLLRGDGAGNFAPPVNFSTGFVPWATAPGDFNGDGKLDLAVAFRNSPGSDYNNLFGLLLGDGTGNFPQVTRAYPVGSNPLAAVIADFNGDNRNDIATANQADNTVSFLFQNGPGDFSAPVNLTGFNSPRALVAADFNGDGKPDLAIANGGSSTVSVLFNDGSGGFSQAPNSPYLVSGDPRSIAVGDLNGDTKLDIVTGAYNGNLVSVLFNLGASGFGNYTEYQLSATVFLRVTDIVVGDFNQDTLLDVAAKDFGPFGDSRITLLFNQGNGALGNRTHITTPFGASLVTGDFNQDGKLDLVTDIFIYLATGGGSFTQGPTIQGLSSPTNDETAADVNGDGKLDLIATSSNGTDNGIFITTGNGQGGFAVATARYIPSPTPYGLAIGDVNDDTKPDIVTTDASTTNGSITRLLNACNKTPADFDDDGRTDISVWNPNNGNWYIFNSRDNSFRTQADWGRASLGDIPVPGDYDGDARQDVAIFRPSEGNWYIINSGFPFIRVQNWGGPGDHPIPADYDGDGRTDFAIFRPSEGNWYILFSGLGTTRVQGWGNSTDKLVPGDYDGDGRADIAVYRPSEGNWYILKSTGGVIQQQWGIGEDIPVPGDYDGDTKTDIAVFRPSDGNWYIIQSRTNTGLIRNWGNSDDVPVPGDYDRDGRTDIAIYRPSFGNWYVILSATNTVYFRTFGVGNEVPLPSTYIPYY